VVGGITQRATIDRIGRYELLKRLATGGMAELFLAKASGIEGFEKVLVLKRILPHLATDSEFVRMFLTEARLAATLDHANIVHVHDIGKEEDEYFFTMEYVHGEDLRRVIRRANELHKPIAIEHALTIITAVAAGLHHAHEQIGFDGRPLGIIHRDVSPSNIIVTYGGGVKVLDFGIAKAGARTNVSRLSTLKGKATYMSPEQCRGAKLDRRSDIFAIAVLLQELLTMKPVYGDKNELMIMHKVASGSVPPIREAWLQCPVQLQNILARALQREPQDRYSTALEFQLDIEAFAHEHRLRLSMAALGQYLEELFGSKPYPWIDRVPEPELAPVREEPASVTPFARPPVGTPVPTLVSGSTQKSEVMPPPDLTVARSMPQAAHDNTVRKPNPTHGHGTTAKVEAQPVPTIVAATGSYSQVDLPPPKRARWIGLAVGSIAAAVVAYMVGARQVDPAESQTTAPAEETSPADGRSNAIMNTEAATPAAPIEPPAVDPEPPESSPPASEQPPHAKAAPAKKVDPPPPASEDAPVEEPVEIELIDESDPPPTKRAPKPRRRRPNPDPDGLLP
jgi:serine/threonine protein kinase